MADTSNPEREGGAVWSASAPYAAAPGRGQLSPTSDQAPAMVVPVGKVRSTGSCILLTIVTLGFYTWYWYYKTHDEMRQYSGTGVGGGVALILAIFLGIVMPFLSSNEVGGLYERSGHARPVSAVTGLWALLLGWFFFVGLIVWFVKTNGALNSYWKSLGAR
ncbi:MAG: DUF4234 domain-containing protein [Actinomycetota bacterium]|nr:DUF4234 domain-containing protein [Actinomycetota bacterium]